MRIFALSDPHLYHGAPDKSMDRFGEIWVDHMRRIKVQWERVVRPGDVVVVPGDVSWAGRFNEAMADLTWLDGLPGQKVLLRGNHDHWWPKTRAQRERFPNSLHPLHHDTVTLGEAVFFGTRLWDTSEYSVFDLIDWDPGKGSIPEELSEADGQRREQIYERELTRLKLSIAGLDDAGGRVRIGLCHFPPLGADLFPTRAARLFEEAGAQHVIFGHLHSLKPGPPPFGARGRTEYHLASCDYLGFKPKLVCRVPVAAQR